MMIPGGAFTGSNTLPNAILSMATRQCLATHLAALNLHDIDLCTSKVSGFVIVEIFCLLRLKSVLEGEVDINTKLK